MEPRTPADHFLCHVLEGTLFPGEVLEARVAARGPSLAGPAFAAFSDVQPVTYLVLTSRRLIAVETRAIRGRPSFEIRGVRCFERGLVTASRRGHSLQLALPNGATWALEISATDPTFSDQATGLAVIIKACGPARGARPRPEVHPLLLLVDRLWAKAQSRGAARS